MSEVDQLLERRAATLHGPRGSVLGVLDATGPGSLVIFEPDDYCDIAMAGTADDIARATWGDDTGWFELDVVVSHRDTKRHVVVLRPSGPPRRVQRRRAVRARVAQPCTVFAIIEPTPGVETPGDQRNGVMVMHTSTIDISAGGAALYVSLMAEQSGLRATQEVGVILELGDRRVAAVARVLSDDPDQRDRRLRLHFLKLRSSDADALTAFAQAHELGAP